MRTAMDRFPFPPDPPLGETEDDAEEPGHPSTKSAREWAEILVAWQGLRHTDPVIHESITAIEWALTTIEDVEIVIDDGFARMLLAHGWDID